MNYEIKIGPELLWALVIAAGTYALQLLNEAGWESAQDWQTYAVAAGVGLARVVIAALLNGVRGSQGNVR